MMGSRSYYSARILIADDHDMVRQAIRQFVETFQGLQVVGEAKNGASAVELAHQLRPHIVLMDFHMPVMDGHEATRTIRRELPEVKVIGLSVHPDTEPRMREASYRQKLWNGDEKVAYLSR
jgi:DNA-binding NarL/FixJ family response regulator